MDNQQAQQHLEAEKTRLDQVLAAARGLKTGAEQASRTELSNADQHPAEQASETLEREIDSTVEQRVQAELGLVDAALGRLKAGRYGLCEVCGKPIADARLEAMPATRYCVDDQAKAERDPRLRSTL
jgi:RNA polymerase-binding transcription factor DksA